MCDVCMEVLSNQDSTALGLSKIFSKLWRRLLEYVDGVNMSNQFYFALRKAFTLHQCLRVEYEFSASNRPMHTEGKQHMKPRKKCTDISRCMQLSPPLLPCHEKVIRTMRKVLI